MGGPRILIVRTSALGDVVHCLPVLTALRRHLPAARIGWVLEERLAPLLAGHPGLDELIPIRTRAWRRRPLSLSTLREFAAFVTALDRFCAEIALDLMGNHKGGAIAALTLADRRIGLARPFRREPSSAIWISESAVPEGVHAVERALAVLGPLGLHPESVDFGAAALPNAGSGAAAERPFVLIHPGAGWANKRYPPEWWGEVAATLGSRAGLESRVAWGPGEEGLAGRVEAASGGRARALAAPDLPLLVSLLRRATLVLGGDTGPVHLAHALGTPVLCLMGPTDPARNGPYAAPERALWKRLPCSFCHQRLEETKACLLELPPRLVAERALELLR